MSMKNLPSESKFFVADVLPKRIMNVITNKKLLSTPSHPYNTTFKTAKDLLLHIVFNVNCEVFSASPVIYLNCASRFPVVITIFDIFAGVTGAGGTGVPLAVKANFFQKHCGSNFSKQTVVSHITHI